MKNIVVLQKDEDGDIICQQVTKKGIKWMKKHEGEEDKCWEDGGSILLDELDDILNIDI
jgi:hypothetical protein